MASTLHDNRRWETVAAALEATVPSFRDRSLFINGHALTQGNEWVGLGAVTSDTGDDEPFFGTRTLNLIVLSQDPGPSDNYDAQRDRIMAHYAQFAAYRTIVYLDAATIVARAAADGDDDVDLEGIAAKLEAVCDELADFGFIYGGLVDFRATQASFFRPAIAEFFGLAT